jgi:serine/threonine-protein kinase HipA
MPELKVLEVLLHDAPIGTLTLLPNNQTLFAFDQAYIDDEGRDTLSQSFLDPLGQLISEVKLTRSKLPPFFSNLLPEGPLREYLARQAGVKPQDEFSLLWMLGKDLPGALSIRSTDDETWPITKDETHASHEKRLRNALRFSLAGVQLKFSARMKGHLTIPTQGIGGDWIVKLPSTKFKDVPENEFSMMQIARQIGLDVPEVRLVPIEEIEGLPDDLKQIGPFALAVKRFDRIEGDKAVHIEDFAQVFKLYPEEKYEKISYRNIAELIWTKAGEADLAEYIRRFAFNALIGNGDMHAKNWSLIYPDRRNPELAPGYDFVSTVAYPAIEDALALSFMGSKKFEDIDRSRFIKLAAKAQLPEKLVLDAVNQTVSAFHETWQSDQKNLPLTKEAINAINKNLARLPIARKD